MDKYLYELVTKIRALFYDTEYEPYLTRCDARIYESDKRGRYGYFDIMDINFGRLLNHRAVRITVYHDSIQISISDKGRNKDIIARNLYDGFDGLLKLDKIDFSKFVDIPSNGDA